MLISGSRNFLVFYGAWKFSKIFTTYSIKKYLTTLTVSRKCNHVARVRQHDAYLDYLTSNNYILAHGLSSLCFYFGLLVICCERARACALITNLYVFIYSPTKVCAACCCRGIVTASAEWALNGKFARARTAVRAKRHSPIPQQYGKQLVVGGMQHAAAALRCLSVAVWSVKLFK